MHRFHGANVCIIRRTDRLRMRLRLKTMLRAPRVARWNIGNLTVASSVYMFERLINLWNEHPRLVELLG